MAKGSGPGVKCYAVLALVTVVLLGAWAWTSVPGMWRANRSEPLAGPRPQWQQRLASVPRSATVAGRAVVIEHRKSVEALSLQAGVRLWRADADWTAVAGAGDAAVVVVGEVLVKGYEVRDPVTGAVLRRDRSAVAVWTYRNLLLDLGCRATRDCLLTAWEPRGRQPLWTVATPGTGFVLLADNPDLPTTRPLTTGRVDADAGGPALAPPLLGLRADGELQVVDTAAGRLVRLAEPAHDRLVVVGGRVLTVGSRARDGTCRFTVTATDPAAAQVVWQDDTLDLRTARGAGCVQRDAPQGGRDVVLGASDGRDVLVDAYDGQVLWRGAPGQRALAVDDRYALVHANRGVSGHPLGGPRPVWHRAATDDAGAALTPYAALVLTDRPARIAALDPVDGRVLVELASAARVLAVGPAGLVLGDGQDVAYVTFQAATPPTVGPVDGDEQLCDGPKEPRCGASPAG